MQNTISAMKERIAVRVAAAGEVVAVEESKINTLKKLMKTIEGTGNPYTKAMLGQQALALAVDILTDQAMQIHQLRELVECQ